MSILFDSLPDRARLVGDGHEIFLRNLPMEFFIKSPVAAQARGTSG